METRKLKHGSYDWTIRITESEPGIYTAILIEGGIWYNPDIELAQITGSMEEIELAIRIWKGESTPC